MREGTLGLDARANRWNLGVSKEFNKRRVNESLTFQWKLECDSLTLGEPEHVTFFSTSCFCLGSGIEKYRR